MFLHHKLTIFQTSSLAKLPLQQIKCLCALCARDAIVRTSSLRPSLLTEIGGHYIDVDITIYHFFSLICHCVCHVLVCHTMSGSAMFGSTTLFEATMFMFAIFSSHFISSLCLCFLQEANASMAMTMAKLPPCHIFFFLESEHLLICCHCYSFFLFHSLALCYSLYLIPYLHLTPLSWPYSLYLLLYIFTLPTCFYHTPCIPLYSLTYVSFPSIL
jgi:hypothetical protein